MNPVLGIIGNMLRGSGSVGNAFGGTNSVGNAQANSVGAGGIGNIFNLIGMLKGSSNPMQMLQTMSQTNPQIKQVFDYVQQNGGDAKSAFYKLAEQNGVDPNNILNMLK